MPAREAMHRAVGGDACAGLVEKQQVAAVGEADNLAGCVRAVLGLDPAAGAGAGVKARAFRDQPVIAQHPSAIVGRGRLAHCVGSLGQPGQKIAHDSPPALRSAMTSENVMSSMTMRISPRPRVVSGASRALARGLKPLICGLIATRSAGFIRTTVLSQPAAISRVIFSILRRKGRGASSIFCPAR